MPPRCVTSVILILAVTLSAGLASLVSGYLAYLLVSALPDFSEPVAGAPTATLANVPGRHFSSLSVHPNSQELLFLEFRDDWPSVSRLLRYHLGTRQLRYYELPPNHVYLNAAFSPNGEFVVLIRAPNVRGDDAVKRKAYAASEIAVMRADGTELRVIPLVAGLKMGGVMSHDAQRIAYWRATQRPPGNKSFATRFDVWEVNLQTGEDRAFSGLFEFFGGGQMQYLKTDDQIIISSDVPMSENMPGRTADNFSSWLSAYSKKHNDNFIYVLTRGAADLPEPIATTVDFATNPSLDDDQNLYYSGFKSTISFFKKTKEGHVSRWAYPGNTLDQDMETIVLPDGSSMAFIFYHKNTNTTKRGIALFDIKPEAWTQINIPTAEEGTPIATKSISK